MPQKPTYWDVNTPMYETIYQQLCTTKGGTKRANDDAYRHGNRAYALAAGLLDAYLEGNPEET